MVLSAEKGMTIQRSESLLLIENAKVDDDNDWGVDKTMQLIHARARTPGGFLTKRIGVEGRQHLRGWHDVSARMLVEGYTRSWFECRKWWKAVLTVYMDIVEHEHRIGVQTYWKMTPVERELCDLAKNFRREWFDLIDAYAQSQDIPPEGATSGLGKAPRRAKQQKQAAKPATALKTVRADGPGSAVASKRMRCAVEKLSQSLKRICMTSDSMKCSQLCTEALERHGALMSSSQEEAAAVIAAKLDEGWRLVAKFTTEPTVDEERSTSTDYKDEYFTRCECSD
ncbi:hypothetical protein CBR_g8097 [Chara braunii]|uniref:Myb-like domain-containing protein n=1 Tax=Chara braunii TaxID=69332 RepID=A0A388KL84_CHABU|nr:hypothetical protein CBR_g8097 [Chara braunii]|eukprot:GBG70797.1 hypothetical protein CBR_g8097 [Chara braunii]